MPSRPYVIAHMVTTIDGKILTKRWPSLPNQNASANLFETTAASFNIPAWIVGTTTMKEFSASPALKLKPAPAVPPGDFIADPKARSFAISVDNHAALRFKKPDVDGDHTIMCIPASAPNAYRAHLRDAGVSYLLCGEKTVSLSTALHKLHTAFRLKKIMAQGGGAFNGSLLREHLVDEISHLILPIADGGGPSVPSLFDSLTPTTKAASTLRLLSLKKLPHQTLWLRYRVLTTK